MRLYGLMEESEFERMEDNPFRIINLLVLLFKELKVIKPTLTYPQIEIKTGKSYLYVTWSEYDEYHYSVKVSQRQSGYDNIYGYETFLDETIQFGNSKKFYKWLAKHYKEF